MSIRKTLFIAIALLSIASVGKAQNKSLSKVEPTIGVGRLQVSLNESIPLYRTLSDTIPYDMLKFDQVKTGEQKGKYNMSTAHQMSLAPMSYYAGDSDKESAGHVSMGLVYFSPKLVFRVVAVSSKAFEVVVNEQTFETSIIRHDKLHSLYTEGKPYWSMSHSNLPSAPAWYLYESWGNYFGRLMSVSTTNPDDVYETPYGNALSNPDKVTSFKVLFLAEQWLKVLVRSYNESDSVKAREGWIKWTDGKTMLVKPVEEVYY